MNRKRTLRQFLSGMMAILTVFTTIFSSLPAYASEEEKKAKEYPLYEEVKEFLDADEVVTAKDLEVDTGSVFDITKDMTGIEIPDKGKVKVTFHEAKNEADEDFSINHADTYKAVYYVEPVSGHPVYQISRKIIVREAAASGTVQQEIPVTDAGTETSMEEQGDEEGEPDSQEPVTEFPIPETETEPVTDGTEITEEETTGDPELSSNETEMPQEPTVEETEVIVLPEEEQSEVAVDTEDGTELETEEEPESETETETEAESDTSGDGDYQVRITKGEELDIVLNHEDGSYDAGETVEFSTNLPEGCLTAVAALKEEANAQGNTADLLYSEVTYHAQTDTFSFEMPAEDIALEVAVDQAQGGIMLLAAGDEGLWDEATEIEANTYYYYSDGQLHPFNSVMGSGGNDSYKYIRYKVGGKTYTVNAYCMQHSMSSPPSGTTYKNMIELDEGGDDKYLRKAFFYGYGGPGWGGTFNGYNIKQIMEKAGCTSETRAMQHYLVDYLYDGESGFGGALSDTAKNMLREIKAALAKMPDPTAMELLPGLSVTANGTETETFTWKANEAFTITIHLEDGVSLVNETTGKTGTGNVTVKGGEKFHLVATTNDISKLKGNYAITSKYPLDFHAMLLKLQNSQDIGFGYYTDSSDISITVDWPEQAQIDIVKQDGTSGAKLAGAVFGIYSDAACTNLITKMPATDNNGASSVTLTKTQDTVYLKEITAPAGYVVSAKAENINLVVGKTVTKTIPNQEQTGSLTVYKEGEVLTGASVTESGTSFQYEKRKLKGAVYKVTAAEDITNAAGSVVYKKGMAVTENLTTGEGGSATLNNLPLGSYVVTEVKAPGNYINNGESKTVTLSYAGQNESVVFANITFSNDRQKAEVTVVKKDRETENPLAGGRYGLFAGNNILNADGIVVVKKDTLVEQAVTGADGSAVYQADLPLGNSYYLKELQAPDNYFRNSEDVYTFTFAYTHDKEPVQKFSHTFTNERVDAVIRLVKKDAETGTPQGDATLEHAVYGLFAREDIVHPDGRTGVVYPAGTQIATLTTDAEGKASVTGLYLGKYYVKEITPSNGYLLDEKEYDLPCNFEGDLVKTVEQACTSPEQVIKQPFQIIKAAQNGKTNADLLKGAGFSAYLVSSLKTKEDGNYDFSSAKPVVIGENGATEIFTDEKGYACSIALPFGTYLVRETTTPHNYEPVDDFIVRITENHPNTPQTWRVLLDDEFEAKLKIIKLDDETKKTVLIPGTEFKIYDLDHEKYVEQVTTYPTTVTHKSYFTDADGYLILPQSLPIGHYRVEEVTAPEGYTINQNYVEVTVDSNTAYYQDDVSKDIIIEAVYENHPVKGELTVVKKGEVLDGYKKDFTYKVQNLAGAVFAVYAAEDIYTADFQKDSNGNRILEYAKDELVAELTTGKDGTATLKNLPLGTYKVVEKTAPEGFVQNSEAQNVQFVYAGQDTPVVSESVEFSNERQKVEISAVKKDTENEKLLAGAEFALYAKEDIKAGDAVIVKADTLLASAVTEENGKAVFGQDLPFGTYYVKETKAPAGFVSNGETIEATASYQGQEVEVVRLEEVFKNQPTITEFTKSDLTTSVELDGATLTVLDQDKNTVDTWTSVKGEPHVIKRLHVGETYILREEFAPYGYLKAEEVEFTVADTSEVQKVEMKDDVPTGRIIINKKGEFIGEITWNDMMAGAMESAFGYVTGSLKDVTFEVYALEDIKAADGESEDYYKKDDLVATITTDALGYARADDLPLGKYYVVEKETAEGFVLDGEAREIDLTYRDQDTPVVTYDEEWQNSRQKAKVTVVKKEKGLERVLEGGVFALCTREDIKNADGKVLLKADTIIEQKATDKEGKILFSADLPVGGRYYVKEVQAPAGFVTTGEVQEFDFTYAGEDQAEVMFDFIFENEPTTVEITKSDLTTGGELPGAKLQVTDKEGNVVDEWISGTTPHVIRELETGREYTLTEKIPADGYVTAESITFTVENTAEVQKVEMKDDVTKVQISKVDMTDGSSEIEGAKLYILNENNEVMESWTSGKEPHYVEKLPVGTYTLLEESAPKGYIISNKVKFIVKDTGEIQSVKMEDDQARGRVILNKTDKDTKKPMKGVEFALCDSKGKVLETLVTDSAGHAESKEYPIATFKNGAYGKQIVYILKETKTMEGYKLDKTEHKVKFSYVDDKTPVVEYKIDLTNEKIPEEQPETPSAPGPSAPDSPSSAQNTPTSVIANSPKTGDHTPILLFVLLMALSAGGIVTLFVMKKHKK